MRTRALGLTLAVGTACAASPRPAVAPGTARERPVAAIVDVPVGLTPAAPSPDAAPVVVVERPTAPPPREPSAHERLMALVPADLSVVFLTVDTLRHDLHYAGNPRELSPNLDRLAAQSVNFANGYAMSSYTGRAIGPLFIGRYPTETANSNSHFTYYYSRNVMLAERLRDAGFHTFGAASHAYFAPHYALQQGITEWDFSAHPPADTDAVSTDGAVANNAIRMLRAHQRPGERFFLWAHFIDPHVGYVRHPDLPTFGHSERDQYDQEVMSTDRHIGRLLAALDALPCAPRTVVVVTADHGEMFHEHGMSRHGRELWEGLVHVPLLVRVPGVAPRVVTTRRSQIDLVPTLLELARVEPPAAGELQGHSLAGDLVGAPPDERPVLIDLPQGPANAPRRAVIDHGWKLVLRGPRARELYHLDDDPGETRDLARTEPAQMARMDAVLRAMTDGFRGHWTNEGR